ncbi:Csu type fimbrial protein [Collimonas sp.]|jgi:spore coat protein U-like protein|uniref:Csu type fimbrial protein n=1 Tax=Collimonas sp. TaxID=1963772 RepID=UPI002B8D09B5|nr:spore coat protein U domain-containing protein [Collimonas sp.]HWX00571.1 spore coat protein U domain-containing protein [Collimonas sp.]
MKLKTVLLASAMLYALSVSPSWAASGNVVVKASIAASCTLAGLGELDFRALDQASNSPTTATGLVTYWCTTDTPYTITLGNGENYDAGSARRQMKQNGGAALLPYQLTADKSSGTGIGPATNERLTLTGTILSADVKNAAAASYLDNVLVTIEP